MYFLRDFKKEALFLELVGMEKHVESPSIIRMILCRKEVPHFHSYRSAT